MQSIHDASGGAGDRTDEFGWNDGTDRPAESRTVTTGTTTVGLAGSDGVVLAADSRASLGGRFVTNRSIRKVEPIGDRAAVTFSGGVSDAQSFVRSLRAERRLYELRTGSEPSTETLATVAGDLLRHGPFRILDLVLGGAIDEPAIYDIDPAGGVLATDVAASGSGMQLAYGALEGAFDPDLPVTELGTVAATAIRSATERDTASGDGMTVATITADGIELERFDDLDSAIDATARDEEVV